MKKNFCMTSVSLNIGFVGLGIMDTTMAGHLIKAGHQLFVSTHGKTPDAIKATSATQCRNASEVAEKANIIIMMVPDTPDVNAALFGESGIAAGLKTSGGKSTTQARKVVGDMS